MATELSATPQGVPRPGAGGYEARDANVKWIFGIVLFLAVSGIAIHFILGWMEGRLRATPAPADAWTGVPKRILPFDTPAAPSRSFPRLQVAPEVDLKSFRAHEDQLLKSYGWIDSRAGLVRLPITRAMDLLLERGLPVSSSSNQPKVGPSSYELQLRRPTERPTPSSP